MTNERDKILDNAQFVLQEPSLTVREHMELYNPTAGETPVWPDPSAVEIISNPNFYSNLAYIGLIIAGCSGLAYNYWFTE